jgi:outer membrane immunogenic protein
MLKCVSVASRLAFACALAATAWSPAGAADIGDYNRGYKDYGDPIVVPSSYFSWTGFYIGGHVGYGWGTSSSDALTPGAFDGATSGYEMDPSGWLGGLTIGYNLQTDALVFGLEADLGYLGAEDGEADAVGFANTEYGGYGTLTARIGYAEDRWLFYGKGGLAFADIENTAGALSGGLIEPDDFTNLHEVKTGWALGVGVEHSFQRNVSLKVEYLYMDFGEDLSSNLDGNLFTHDNDIHTLKIGLNYNLQRTYEPLR